MADQPSVSNFFDNAFRLDFYQAVRLLERAARQARAADDLPFEEVGSGEYPAREAVRFRGTRSMAFPPSDLREVTFPQESSDPRDPNGRPPLVPEMEVAFMSLTGALGPLPRFYTELIRERLMRSDTGLRDFFDLFEHRLVSLFYRVRQKSRPALYTGAPESHSFARFLWAVAGLAEPRAGDAINEVVDATAGSERGRRDLRARDLLIYSGLLWHRDRSLTGLESLLRYHFGFDQATASASSPSHNPSRATATDPSNITVGHGRKNPLAGVRLSSRPLSGRWYRLGAEERTALSVGSHHNRLGRNTVVGGRVWDPQAGFELALQPLDWQGFVDFLPTGQRFRTLDRLVRIYTRQAFELRLSLGVKREEIIANRPGLDARQGPQLGLTSWLVSHPRSPVDGWVSLRAVAAAPPKQSLALAIVVEVSAAMYGRRLDLARQLISQVIDALAPGDELAVLTLGTQAEPLVPLMALDGPPEAPLSIESHRARAKSALDTLHARGPCVVLEGPQAGLTALGRARASQRRVMLLASGRTDEGPEDPATLRQALDRWAARPEATDSGLVPFVHDTAVSTLQMGGGPHADRLRAIARWGGGGFHVLRSPNDIEAIVERQLARSKGAVSGSRLDPPGRT